MNKMTTPKTLNRLLLLATMLALVACTKDGDTSCDFSVLGKLTSAEEDSFSSGLLEYPQYTRPDEWHGRRVPDILLSGDHGKVDNYRMHEMRRITKEIRPDLYMKYMEERGIY